MSQDQTWPKRLGEQLGFLIDRVATLAAAFRDLAKGCEDAVHAADRAQIDALVEQGRVDLDRGLIGEARRAQLSKHLIPFALRQGAR